MEEKGEKNMNEMNRTHKGSKRPFKAVLLLFTLMCIYLGTMIPVPTIHLNAPLLQSALYSLLILVFWVIAYHVLVPRRRIHIDLDASYSKENHPSYHTVTE